MKWKNVGKSLPILCKNYLWNSFGLVGTSAFK